MTIPLRWSVRAGLGLIAMALLAGRSTADEVIFNNGDRLTGKIVNAADGNGNNLWDAGEGEQWTKSDAAGHYALINLGPMVVLGVPTNPPYMIREVQQAHFTQTTTNPAGITLLSGQNVTGIDIGNIRNGRISGLIFNDFDGDGVHDVLDGQLLRAGQRRSRRTEPDAHSSGRPRRAPPQHWSGRTGPSGCLHDGHGGLLASSPSAGASGPTGLGDRR